MAKRKNRSGLSNIVGLGAGLDRPLAPTRKSLERRDPRLTKGKKLVRSIRR